MKIKILNEDKDLNLIERLFKVRWISDDPDAFINAKLSDYRKDPFLLNDMWKAVDRILQAFKNTDKIVIFGDYDVDGVTSSYTLYHFFKDWLNYPHVEIMYPSRQKDGYGLKNKHLDSIKDKWVKLVITVDNGITSIWEADYAKNLGIDLIITDHHHALDTLPDAFAVVNPKISPDYPFDGLAGVWVAFKLLNAILSKSNFSKDKKNQCFEYFLAIVAVGTVADVVPLQDENRLIVKKWLELINYQKHKIPKSLKWFLEFTKIKGAVESYHFGFVIWPRINAWGRITSPYDSLNILLHTWEDQIKYMQKIEDINTERKKLQEKAIKIATKLINIEEKIIIACDEEFHEWIVGIVSGRLTDQFYKPSMVVTKKDTEELYVASLRWPAYFDVIAMIQSAEHLLERFGWHQRAWWLSVKPENFQALQKYFENYCREHITDEDLEREIFVDTVLLDTEREYDTLSKIDKLAPFGEGNSEPVFLIKNVHIEKINKIGKNGNGHLKLLGDFQGNKIACMLWGKWAELEEYEKLKTVNIVGKIKKDTYNGWYFVDGIYVTSS